MAWYSITYACGHDGRVNIVGPVKNRQWIADRHAEKLCPECWEAEKIRQREEENAKAAEAAKEQELPVLVGSEKQVAWAETIRQKFLAKLQETLDYKHFQKYITPDVVEAAETYYKEDRARWWIDNARNTDLDRILRDLIKRNEELKAQREREKIENSDDAKSAKIEATVRPENPVTETVAEIKSSDDAVEIVFPEKRDDFRKVVKNELQMKWSGSWKRSLKPRNGSPIDRAAESGHRLLAAGFIIRIYDAQTREKAIHGTYEPECTNWVLKRADGKYDGWFAISWGSDDDYYKAARRLSGSRWSNPAVVVPPEHFQEVLDFTEMYGFKLSEAAQEVVNTARQEQEKALCVSVDAVAKHHVVADGTPPKLEVPEKVEVDEELCDDD